MKTSVREAVQKLRIDSDTDVFLGIENSDDI